MGSLIVKADLNGTYVEGNLITADETTATIDVVNDEFLGVTGVIIVPRNQIIFIGDE